MRITFDKINSSLSEEFHAWVSRISSFQRRQGYKGEVLLLSVLPSPSTVDIRGQLRDTSDAYRVEERRVIILKSLINHYFFTIKPMQI